MRLFPVKQWSAVLAVCLFCVTGAWAQRGSDGGRLQSPGDPKTRARLHTELAALYFQDGNNAVALDELRIALDADSDYFPAYSVRGLVHATLKEYPAADDDFRRALRLAPNDPDVNNNYGWYLCETGKARQSIAYFLNALKDPLYATPERAYANAGTCAMKAGDLTGAETYLQQALRLAPDGAPMARLELATLHYRRGSLEEARRYLNDALKQMEPPTASALWLGIRLERKLGNRVTDGGYAAQLRSRYPGSPEYQEFLDGKFDE